MYLIFRNVNEWPTNKSKEKVKKYNNKELSSKTRDLIKSVTEKSDDYDEKYEN